MRGRTVTGLAAEVRVLGPLELSTESGVARLRPREASVVAALALGDRTLDVGDLVEMIWTDPPASAVDVVRNQVSRLRRGIGPFVSVGGGYRLVAEVAVDARQLEQIATSASAGRLDGSVSHQLRTLRAARGWWRGEAFPELVDHPRVVAAREHLEESRRVVDTELAAVLLDAGSTEEAHALLTELVRADPRRSRRWSLLALASYRLGRRDEALAASIRANDFRTDAEPVDDEQVALILRDDSILLTIPTRHVPRRPVPIVAPAIDPEAQRRAFVGRTGELERLARIIDDGTRDGATPKQRLALVQGDAGIGKTYLAYRAATEARRRGVVALWSWCDPGAAGSTAVVGRLLRDLVASEGVDAVAACAGDDLAAVVALVPDARWTDEHRAVVGDATVAADEAAVRTLAAAARGARIVCVVDDVQWSTPSTARVLTDLSQRPADLVVLVVLRGVDPPAWLRVDDAMVVSLDELDRDAVRTLVARSLGAPPSDPLVARIRDIAGGHPLMLRELLATIDTSSHDAIDAALSSVGGVPHSVAEAVSWRLGTLRPPARTAVEAASVLGRSFSPRLLADIVDLDAEALADATTAGILAPESRPGRVRFCHDLVRAAVYEHLPLRRRTELHQAAGRALRQRRVPRWDEIAHHDLAAASVDQLRAARSCRRAGDAAAAEHRFDDATALHRTAVELLEASLPPESPELLDALIALGEALARAGATQMVEVLDRAARAAERSGDGERLARAVALLCAMNTVIRIGARPDAMQQVVDRALAADVEPATTARVAAAGASIFAVADEWPRARELFELAESIPVDGLARLDVLRCASLALGGPDDLGRRARAADELELLADQHGEPSALVEALLLRAGVQIQLADPAFRATVDRMVALGPAAPDPRSRWLTTTTRAARAHLDGDLDAAEAIATESLGVHSVTVAHSRAVAAYGGQLVALRREQGRLAEMVPLIEGQDEQLSSLPAWRVMRAAARAELGDEARFAVDFDELAADDFEPVPRDYSWTASLTMLTSAAAGLGDAVRARRAYDVLAPYAGRLSWAGLCTFGPVDQALGEAAHACSSPEARDAHLQRAASLADRLGAPRMAARARLGIGAPLGRRLPGPGPAGIVS